MAHLAVRSASGVDLRMVCPQDVKKLFKQARMVYWKEQAATHECEDLKEGVWLEPIQAVLRRKTNGPWAEKLHKVRRTWVVDGGGCRKMYDIGWSDEKKCRMRQRRRRGETQVVPPAAFGGKLETRS